ncbi:hypothetical protein ACRYCC_07750 [Actinomadura scrupuli]|uniref:hypothetical protein n=1 Tax=Actinomadura scrupuli TaxID=559629 RepID=UPI003D954759
MASFTPEVVTAIVWSVRAQLFWIIPVAGVGLLWGIARRLTGRDGKTEAVVALSLLLLWLAGHHNLAAGQHNVDSALPVPGVSQGDGFVADYDRTQYQGWSVFLDGSQDYPFTSLIREREHHGLFGGSGGYAAIVAQNHPVPQYGQTRTCRFSDQARATLDGWGSDDLTRKVNELRPFVRIDERNVNWICSFDDSHEVGIPKVIMPLKAQQGIFFVTEKDAGVAIYNGLTGLVTIEDHPPTRSTRLPGVVDPIDTMGGRPLTVG